APRLAQYGWGMVAVAVVAGVVAIWPMSGATGLDAYDEGTLQLLRVVVTMVVGVVVGALPTLSPVAAVPTAVGLGIAVSRVEEPGAAATGLMVVMVMVMVLATAVHFLAPVEPADPADESAHGWSWDMLASDRRPYHPALRPAMRAAPVGAAQVKDVQVVSASLSQWLRRGSARSVVASAPAPSSEGFSQDGSWIGEVKEPTRSATASMLVSSSAACGTISTSPTSRITTANRPITLLAPGWRRPKRARRPSSERSCGRRGCGCPPSSGTKCIRDRPYMLVATSIVPPGTAKATGGFAMHCCAPSTKSSTGACRAPSAIFPPSSSAARKRTSTVQCEVRRAVGSGSRKNWVRVSSCHQRSSARALPSPGL